MKALSVFVFLIALITVILSSCSVEPKTYTLQEVEEKYCGCIYGGYAASHHFSNNGKEYHYFRVHCSDTLNTNIIVEESIAVEYSDGDTIKCDHKHDPH